jgi:tetratricopeptide (TPR) repeat protein
VANHAPTAGHRERAGAALVVGDVEGAIAHLSSAIRELSAAGDCRQAAMVCVELGDLFADYVGNLTAARAWFVRASRLVEHEPPCVEQGWAAVAAVGCDVDDPAELLARAELALDRARRFGDVNLETKALADAGLAHVQSGRIVEGMALLDEAMALASGPADDLVAAGKSVCSFLTACYYTGDFHRAGSWADVLRRQGLIGPVPGVPTFLASHCDAVHATLLCELGRWSEAEAVLLRASAQFEDAMGSPSWHPAIALAELRIRQGRLAEAEALLLGKEGHVQALLPAARLHLARRDYELARATAVRGLRAIGGDRLRAAELLAVLVDVEVATGDRAAAAAACADLVRRAEGLGVPGLEARVAAVQGHAQAAAGDVVGAIETVERALDRMLQAGLPLLRATLLLELVRLHDEAGNMAAARVEAGRAAATMAGLDVTVAPADVALLHRFGATAPVPAGHGNGLRTARLRREGRGWAVDCGEVRGRIADTKGIRYLAELLRTPGVERHALDLVDCVEGVAGPDPGGVDRRLIGDAGDLVDGRARSAYRHRIEALRAEIDDAMASGFEEQAEALQAELDQLVMALAGAFGLGGRSRKAASAAERARLNVTRALRAAAARLTEIVPEDGPVLDKRLRTGTYCAYEPDEGDEIRWVVQS